MRSSKWILAIVLCAASISVFGLLRSSMSWEAMEKASAIGVNLTILAGAAAAVFKFQLYNLLGHRWRSDLACHHYDLADGTVIFTADYTITNTGERPLRLSDVRVRLVGARLDGVLLCPDGTCLAERVLTPNDTKLKGLFQVEPGERSIFTLRCRLPTLDDVVFVECGFALPHRRVPAAYSGIYVKAPAEAGDARKPPRIAVPALFAADPPAINPG